MAGTLTCDGARSCNHAKRHIPTAKQLMSRNARWAIGALLHNELHRFLSEKESGQVKGLAALRRGGLVKTMWVLKNDVPGMHRGEQVHRRAMKEHLEAECGARFRTVRFPREKAARRTLKRMARAMSPLHHPVQFGFVPKRDCVQSAAQHADARTVYLLDIENAFDQVTQGEVVEILRRVFILNHLDALMISEMTCHKGRLYQGSPIAPAIFNIRAMWMCERLGRLCRANGCTVTVYADDITISTPHWGHFSQGFQRTVRRIIRECGLVVNADKCKVRAVSPRKIGHYDITGLTVDFDEVYGTPYVRPLHRKRTEKKAAFFERLHEMGITTSRERARDGAEKGCLMIAQGLRCWAERSEKPPDRQLSLRHMTQA